MYKYFCDREYAKNVRKECKVEFNRTLEIRVKGEMMEMKRYSKSGYQRDEGEKQMVKGDNQSKLMVIKTPKRKSVNFL